MPAREMTRIFIGLAAGSQFGNLFESRRSGFAGNKWDNHNPPSCLFDGAPLFLLQGFQRVIAALDVDVRLSMSEKTCGAFLLKDADAVHALQGGEHGAP